MGYAPNDSVVPGNSAGAYTSLLDKFLIHTTEGSSIAGAVAAYVANNSWPHMTVECRFGKTYHRQAHVDLNLASRSLRNLAGGVQTNTDGVVQIEVVGAATNPSAIDWGWLGANVVGPICRQMGIPIVSTVVWLSYPASYGNTAVRLSQAEWTNYKGILGHQHAPENAHGDPGAIPIATLLSAAGASPTVPTVPSLEDLMPFPVIATPTDTSERPWTALLPGTLVRFVNWDPLPVNTPGVIWANGAQYYSGGAAGLYLPIKRMASVAQYDEACQAAQFAKLTPA